MPCKGHGMPTPEKLSRLMELADQGPALRAALAEEVAELLASWPPDYPESMREICEALLANAARDIDAPSRAKLRVQLCSQPRLAQRVLPRDVGSQLLIEAARTGRELTGALAQSLGVGGRIAHDILEDESGAKLAVACKAACMDRTVFSALVLLTHPARDRSHAFDMLDAFDTVPVGEASRRLRNWQSTDQLLSA
ncbi:MAG TPA: DUF2336 domain-containing protein [Rhizomicrobium sp.]|nr:DUF2336 domain-containing protein [Rhizomicrobium sp.]